MGVTKLLRKAQKNKSRAHNRLDRIKELMRKPEVKNVDIEAIKAEFATGTKPESKSTAAPKADIVAKETPAPKVEKAETATESKEAVKTEADKADSAE